MAERTRQESREAFILHGYAYRETSLLVEVFTRGFGRISMVARGARGARSALRGVLLAFQPLALSWLGKGEGRPPPPAPRPRGAPLPPPRALVVAFLPHRPPRRPPPPLHPHDPPAA